jgi:hypothetical protein
MTVSDTHAACLCCTHTHAACVANAATMPCAAAGPSGGDLSHPGTEGIDHNRGEKKFPYAKARLTALMGGMENVQLMTIPHRLRSQLVTLLTIVKPDTTAAINFIFGFWICAFKSVYQCQLGRLRMSVRLLVPTPSFLRPAVPSPAHPPHMPSVPHSQLQLIIHEINSKISVSVAIDLQTQGFSNRRMNRLTCIYVNPFDVAVCFCPTPLPHPSAPTLSH